MAKTSKSGISTGGGGSLFPGENASTAAAMFTPPTPPTPPAPQGIQSVSEANDIHEIRHYMRTRGVKVGHSLDGMEVNTAKALIGELDAIMDEFPQAKADIKWIAGNEHNPFAFASARFGGGIELNLSQMPDLKTLDRHMKGNGRFHPKNNTGINVVSHETGHLLERALITKELSKQPFGQYMAGSYWNNSTMSTQVIHEAVAIIKKTPAGRDKNGKLYTTNTLLNQISGYATKNRSEGLAEAVADYRANGSNAHPLSIEIWKILKRELG